MARAERDTIKHLNLHIKILTPPDLTIQEMIAAMNAVFSTANIVVDLITTEDLNLRRDELEFFNRIDVGACNVTPSDEQIELSGFRNNAGNADVVVYICEAVMGDLGALDGCGTHPQGRPMAVISSHAALYTLAHEIGHVLGLEHCLDKPRLRRRLMNRAAPTIPPPPPHAKLIKKEKTKMQQSGLLL